MEVKEKPIIIVDMEKPGEDEEWLPYTLEVLNGLTYGCYILRNKAGEMIYIGEGEIINRLWAHAPFFKRRLEETYPDAVSFKIIQCDTKKLCMELQTRLLKAHKLRYGDWPKHNKKG